MIRLYRCPKCGSDAAKIFKDTPQQREMFRVNCGNCGYGIPRFFSEESAAKAWNMRQEDLIKIKQITQGEADRIIETREPLGSFILKDNKTYIGISNESGDAWMEEFTSIRKCRRWLRGSLSDEEE